ncbi:hypothetical protein [Nitrospirillum viridazoti]|uniref:hypothetical protein n=1 Tax=Nitrospirillum viridazoti TaxID=3144925 RepID=UPI00119E9C39|nr:hypothetical protein [Nitrospirillum amazonense]
MKNLTIISIKMAANLIGAASFLAVILIIYKIYTPSIGVFVDDADAAAAVLVREYLKEETGDFYVSINGHDIDEKTRNSIANNNLILRNLSELPECNVSDDRKQDPSCEEKKILRAEFKDEPIEDVALVDFTKNLSGGGGIVVKIAGRWLLLKSHMNYCSLETKIIED